MVLLIIVVMIVTIRFAGHIYSLFDHQDIGPNSRLDPNAHITHISSEKVMYKKNDAKLKTIVHFSDGFTFVTYDTDRVNHFASYTISANHSRIRENAQKAHDSALLTPDHGNKKHTVFLFFCYAFLIFLVIAVVYLFINTP